MNKQTRNTCPMKHRPFNRCAGKRCAWWTGEDCAMLHISTMTHGIYGEKNFETCILHKALLPGMTVADIYDEKTEDAQGNG